MHNIQSSKSLRFPCLVYFYSLYVACVSIFIEIKVSYSRCKQKMMSFSCQGSSPGERADSTCMQPSEKSKQTQWAKLSLCKLCSVCQSVPTDRKTKIFWQYYLKFHNLPHFIEYNAHMGIVRTWISQWFLAKKIFLFFKNNLTRIIPPKFIHHKSHLKPFLSYLPCMVRREYFTIIFNVKSAHYTR
jgi:hypothetical protein